ncbi:Xaa-Pro peptidase family protein [Mesorhizobium sp. VK4C]|uniref:M24 family metallopeptidase n=1 Tax=Mesorhizobium captivum TaxID=3072319 RepID=UPI002A2441AF|nr:Xaa-Pro peptidase family protein [Mesorhizobium sp. VK4C]MDX8503123.1 Xaa-Pro peptidase family protein [Mesorhizobium sp. VK4C]
MSGGNIVQAFETSEYRTRLDNVRTRMCSAGMDALVVISQANQCYLLGYESFSGDEPQAVLVTLDEDPYFILRKMDADAAADAGCWLPPDRVVAYAENYVAGSGEASAWELIGRFVKDKVGSFALIGVEASGMGVFNYPKLVGALGVQEPLDASDLVAACRLVKSERELLYLSEAAAIADRAMLAGIDEMAAGTRHCDAAAAIMSALCAGTETIPGGPPPSPPFIRGGKFANAPHQFWIDDVFALGHQYYLGIGASRHRYVAPMTRTAHVGPITPRRKNQHEGALAGFHAAVDALRPGATCADVARASQAAIRPYGLTKESRLGYSVGLDWLDGPSLGTNNDTEILANMTFLIHLGFYERGELYMLSDTVRVAENGSEAMSKLPRILFERSA